MGGASPRRWDYVEAKAHAGEDMPLIAQPGPSAGKLGRSGLSSLSGYNNCGVWRISKTKSVALALE